MKNQIHQGKSCSNNTLALNHMLAAKIHSRIETYFSRLGKRY